MFSAVCLLASLAILFFVIQFRVHVHVTYTPTRSRGIGAARKRGRSLSSDPNVPPSSPSSFRAASPERSSGPIACQSVIRTARPIPDSVVWGDIASGLVNLGAQKRKAEIAAKKAVAENPDATFDIQFSVALQEVRCA